MQTHRPHLLLRLLQNAKIRSPSLQHRLRICNLRLAKYQRSFEERPSEVSPELSLHALEVPEFSLEHCHAATYLAVPHRRVEISVDVVVVGVLFEVLGPYLVSMLSAKAGGQSS